MGSYEELDYLNEQGRLAPSRGVIAWGYANGASQNLLGDNKRIATVASEPYTYAYPTTWQYSKIVLPHHASAGASAVAIGIRIPSAQSPIGGQIDTWGSSSVASMGRTPSLGFPFQYPTAIVAGSFVYDWVTAAGGSGLGLAIRATGQMYGWGAGTNGLHGRGNTTSYNTVTLIGTDTNWAEVWTFNGAISFATKSDGTLWATGLNTAGMTGLNTSTGTTTTWTQVGTATDYLSCKITATGTSSATTVHLVKSNGTLWVWGAGHARMGVGATAAILVPTQVGTATDWATPIGGVNGFLCSKVNGDIWGAGTLTVFSKTGTSTMALQFTAAQLPSWKQFIGTPVGTNGTYYLVATNGDLYWTGDATWVWSTTTAATSLTRIATLPASAKLATAGYISMVYY